MRARAWLLDQALPLWRERGRSSEGDFVEGLTLAGAPETDTPRRTLVQARQIYAFCEAERLGWSGDGAAIAGRALKRLLARNWSPDGEPGWAHALARSGEAVDARRQLYDHAFVLFALARARDVLGSGSVDAPAASTVAFLDSTLADPTHGGFQEGLPPTLPRRSNPHMHMLEAWLAWLEATGDERWAVRAQAIVDLFERAFFDGDAGVLTEHFQGDWRRAAGDVGDVVEPGHLYEWAWLLDWADRLGLRTPARAADALFSFAEAHGLDQRGFVVDELDRTGSVRRATRRLWPQTERIKALVARARAGDAQATEGAERHTHALLDTYLAAPEPGAWIDRFDQEGRPAVNRVPASSLYHVVMAVSELQTLA